MSSRAKRLLGNPNTLSTFGRGKRAATSLPIVSNWRFLPTPRSCRRIKSPSSMIYRLFSHDTGESNDVKAHQCWSTGDNHLLCLLGTRRTIRDPGRAQLRLPRRSDHWPSANPDELCGRCAQDRATVRSGYVLLLSPGDRWREQRCGASGLIRTRHATDLRRTWLTNDSV